MKKTCFLSAVLSVVLVSFGCGSGGGGGGDGTFSQGIRIVGSASGYEAAALRIPLSLKAAVPAGCPDDSNGGLSLNLSPVDNSFKLATRFVRLLKEGSEDSYELPACTHETAAEAEADAISLGSANQTICELTTAIPEEAVGTYDGIEIAIYYVEMTIPMVVPQISADAADYPIRIYYNNDEASGILARDILIYDATAGKWGYVDWDDTSQLAYVDEGRPNSLLDAFSNDGFWCADCEASPELCPVAADRRQCSADNPDLSYKDPVTLSTRDDSGFSDFRMEGSFTIASAAEAHTISMTFDVADTLSVWENVDDIDDAEHSLNVVTDCGFHPLFPTVEIAESLGGD